MRMELRLPSQRWARHRPDWKAAVVSGLLAGAVLMVLELLWSATVGEGPWQTSHLVAAIVMGPQALESPLSFNATIVSVAVLTHYVLGMVFGVVLALLITWLHYESSPGRLEVLGVLFGAVVYLVNFHGLSALFPWMAQLRGWDTFIGHLVFGLTLVLAYWRLQERPESE
jgi:hypothetical protein